MLWPAASNIPSMLYGILGAMIVWPLLKKLKLDCYVDKQTISQLCSLCMEIIVLTVVATLNLKFLAANIVPILIYSVILVAMTLFLSFYLPYRFAEDEWFEKGCMIFGHTTGTGCNKDNIVEKMQIADAACVGTAFKKDGKFYNTVDGKRVKEFMDTLKEYRKTL